MKHKIEEITINYEGTELKIDMEIECESTEEAEIKEGKFWLEFQEFLSRVDTEISEIIYHDVSPDEFDDYLEDNGGI